MALVNSEPELIAELKPEGIFELVSPPDLEALKFYGTFGEYAPGEVVVKEGDEQNRLCAVIAGVLDVHVNSDGDWLRVGECVPGDSIGEVSIFEPGPASATVKVRGQAVLWHLDVEVLQNFFE